MRKTTLIGLAAAAALLAAGIARGATVGVSTVVSGGGAPTVTSQNAPTVPVTLTGDDQTKTYDALLQVVDARGLATGGGWNVTMSATQFSDGSGHTLPANAQTVTGVSQSCHAGSTCTTAVTQGITYPIGLSTSPAKIVNAQTGTGLGRIDLDVAMQLAVPANTIAASYSSTLTVAAVLGP